MTSSCRGRGYCQYSMFYDVYLDGEGVDSFCPRCHKDTQNLCKAIIFSRICHLEVAFNVY